MSQPRLLDAKIVIPKNTSYTLQRKRIVKLLEIGETTPLLVVRAPAGYGKTTMLCQWAHKSTNKVAWVTLDYLDNDPIRFWQHITKAIGNAIQSNLYKQLLPLFETQPRLPIEWFVDLISSKIKENSFNCTLILDNYETIKHTEIHRTITRFIDNISENCHVIIATEKEVPLPTFRWKKISLMEEISSDDIKFTEEETSLYLQERGLTRSDLCMMQDLLELLKGWPTGVALAVNMIGNGSQILVLKEYLQKNNPDISHRLFRGLLTITSAENVTFLLQTSVLNYLEPELCNQLTNRKDSAYLLSKLESKGLLMNKLSETDPFFCYHHTFREFLRRELGTSGLSTEFKSLHSIAAEHLYGQNDFMNAIEVALRGGIYSKAAKWIDKHVTEVFALGQTETYLRWVELLISKDEKISVCMITMHAYALALLDDYEYALQVLEQLEVRNISALWITDKAYEADRADYLGVKAYALLFGRYDINTSINLLLERSILEVKETKLDIILIHYNVISPQILRTKFGMQGKLRTEEVMEVFFDFFNNTAYRKLNIAGYSYALRAETLVERNRIEEAIPILEEALQSGFQFQDLGLIVPMYLLKCKIEVHLKRFKAAFTLLEFIEYYVIKTEEEHWLDLIYTMRANILLVQKKYGEAKEELFKVDHTENYIGGAENEFWWFVYARLLILDKEYDYTLETLNQMKKTAKVEEQISTIIEAGLLQAHNYAANDENRLALDELHEALEWGYQYGYMRIFLDNPEILPLIQTYIALREKNRILIWDNIPLTYVETIQVAFKQEQPTRGKGGGNEKLLHLLTPREWEVLELLKTGLSNREIAEKLYLAPGTVRIYLSNIYGKLNVTSRTQAIIIAKDT